MRRALLVAALLAGLAPAARAERPVLAGEATFGAPGGEILVHYATSGGDAPAPADADLDGVPDFVGHVATTAELALARFVALGFRRPISDGALGGDGRIDIYLRDLSSADGNAGLDSCDATNHCIGHVSAENDFAGYAYQTLTEGIRSVVPHELFHLVQDAYATDQPATWTEASAMWSVEHLFGDGCSDLERFLPAFVTRSFRPFDRPVGGFGDGYAYGAGLWPLYLEQRFGVGVVVAAWQASEHASFLDAIDEALRPAGSTTDDAWVDFTRANLFTGARAAGGDYAEAAAWPEVPREPAIATTGEIFIEGLSARYVPIHATARSQLAVTPTAGIRVAAWVVADAAGLIDGAALAGAPLSTTIEPGDYTLVVTGLSRATLTTAVTISLAVDPPPADAGCRATRPSPAAPLLVLAALLATRSRRRARPTRS